MTITQICQWKIDTLDISSFERYLVHNDLKQKKRAKFDNKVCQRLSIKRICRTGAIDIYAMKKALGTLADYFC